MLTNNGKALLYCSDYLTFNKENPPKIYTVYGNPDNGYYEPCTESWNPRYTLQRTNGIAETLYKHTGDNGIEEKLDYIYLASSLEVVVGSGTTPATVNDYNLDNEIISANLKVLYENSQNKTNCNRRYTEPLIMHAQKQYYNASLIDNIIINEIGLITKDGYGYSYLLLREVLSEPIILGPDETITLTILLS